MKDTFNAFIIFLVIAALPLVSLAGCSDSQSSVQNSAPTYSESSTNNLSSTGKSESSTVKPEDNSSEDTASNIPKGEPTFLIGPDGKAILTNEITRLENTGKTAETLTEDDIGANVYCDGLAYYKEPCGVGYDTYKNPELFDGYDFLGEVPENKNEWKRVYVGDEICGMKVKAAAAHFMIDGGDAPERHFWSNDGIELEGTIEVEGFLQVNIRNVMYPTEDEYMWFYPSAADLPLGPSPYFYKNRGTGFDVRGVFNHVGEFNCAGEFDKFFLGFYRDADCDMDGIGVGDVAYARVTLGNIKCVGSSAYATLEKVELLSEILAHDKDVTEKHQPAPVL